MLPKFHKDLGYDVEIIASLETFDKNGKGCILEKGSSYLNEYGIPVTRLDFKDAFLAAKLKRYVGVQEAIAKSRPDIIFIHGCQFMEIGEIVRYCREHPNVKVYVDNHADFSNSATNFISKNILHKVIWRRCAHLIKPYTTKFYGVLPARVDFLANIYKLPRDKIELLVMGADDDKVIESKDPKIRNEIREKYGVDPDDFLVITGGKIDAAKKQILLLMQAVDRMPDQKVKLIVFGSVTNELKDEVSSLCRGSKVQYIGWLNAEDTYRYFAASDLAVFPGRHSVFWEQVTGQGIPMLVKHWEGTTHIDLGGNVAFLYNDSVEEIRTKVLEIFCDKELYLKMKSVAVKDGIKTFSYKEIAKRSIV